MFILDLLLVAVSSCELPFIDPFVRRPMNEHPQAAQIVGGTTVKDCLRPGQGQTSKTTINERSRLTFEVA